MTTPTRFQFVEETFRNYETTKANYPKLSQATFDEITGVVKTVDTKHVYDDLNPAIQHLKQIIPPALNAEEDDAVLGEMSVVAHDNMLARMGGVMLLCSLIENRLRAMYRQRMAVVNGTHTLTAAEEAEIYENLPNNPDAYKLKRDVTEALRIATFLFWCHDVDIHTFHLLEQFTKVRNALIHDAMFRSARFTDDVLRFLYGLYTHMQNMRTKMHKRVPRERQLYAEDGQRDARIAAQLEGIAVGAQLTRDEVYRRLAGSVRFRTPMVHRRFVYVVVPLSATQTGRVKLDVPAKLLDAWNDVSAPWLTPTPVFREVTTKHTVEFCGYGTVYNLEYDNKVFKGLSVRF
jgi:hypothetical protein